MPLHLKTADGDLLLITDHFETPEVFPVKCPICIRRSANGQWAETMAVEAMEGLLIPEMSTSL